MISFRYITLKQYFKTCITDANATFTTVIYGAGKFGQALAKRIRHFPTGNVLIPMLFADRDFKKHGKIIDGIPIMSPEQLVKSGGPYHLVLGIENCRYPFRELLDFVETSLMIPTKSEKILYSIVDDGIIFQGNGEYNQANHWFLPLCYDRIPNFEYEYTHQLKEFIRKESFVNGIIQFEDASSPYINIQGGKRVTVGPPQAVINHVYFFGDSRIFALDSEDKHTIPSFLQEKMAKTSEFKNYEVLNYGRYAFIMASFYKQIQTFELQQNDTKIAITN